MKDMKKSGGGKGKKKGGVPQDEMHEMMGPKGSKGKGKKRGK